MADRIAWGRGRKEEFAHWAQYELDRVRGERGRLEARWRDWLTLYRAPRKEAPASIPFEGASNRIYPATAMALDPIWANLMQTVHAPQNIWTVSPLNERWIDAAKPLQDYLQWLDLNVLKMWDTDQRVFLDMLKLGTGIYKVSWRFEQTRVTGYDENLQRAQLLRTINRPTVDHVSLADFYIPPEALNIDPDAQAGAAWCAHRFRLRPASLARLAKAQEPFLPNYDAEATAMVLKFEESAPTEQTQRAQELDKFETSHPWRREVELFELHARFDTSGNGIEDDVIVVYHLPSATVLRGTFNPYAHGRRPFHAVRYLRADGFYGIGVCEQAEMWQGILTDVTNSAIDKAFLANAPMFAYKEGANILPNESIFPGKFWPMTEADDLRPLFLTDNRGLIDYQVLFGLMQDGVKQRTGVTDLRMGNVGALPSRTPATTIQSLLQESNTRFDLTIKDLRLSGLSDVGLQVLQLIQQQASNVVNNPEGGRFVELAAMVLGQPEGSFVQQALALPLEPLEAGVGVQLTATSGTNNKELQRQNFLALMQLLTQQLAPFFVQMAMTAQQAAGTPTAEIATSLLQGGVELTTRLLEQFDIRNVEDIVPNANAMVQALSAPQGALPGAPLPGQPLGGGQPTGMVGAAPGQGF